VGQNAMQDIPCGSICFIALTLNCILTQCKAMSLPAVHMSKCSATSKWELAATFCNANCNFVSTTLI